MPTTEHTINDAIAERLRSTRRLWAPQGIVSAQNTGMLKGTWGVVDILVVEPNVSPVAIETEVLPAITVESEARARLGAQLKSTGGAILSAIAVRTPARFRTRSAADLRREVAAATDLEFALFTGTNPETATRWPESGWLRGGLADLSLLTQSATVPPEVVERGVSQLFTGVSEAAGIMAQMADAHPGAVETICHELRQQDSGQTRGMAATILANALVFHDTLANGPGQLAQVQSLTSLRGSGRPLKTAVLAEWAKILNVNYWPIFDIARRILEVVPTSAARALILQLSDTADRLLESRLMRSHDLTGAVFQQLIADRKYLAAFYTTPGSAALLVGLALDPSVAPGGGSWGDPSVVTSLRLADFACGTGTLLSTAYQRIGQLHELSGGDSEAIHAQMMANSLIGCDVLPAAAHLTASMLAGAHPTQKYEQSAIMTVAYGPQPNRTLALGSLDLLDPQRQLAILAITAKTVGGMGEREQEIWASLPHDSFDLVLMNPPFTRPTGHEAAKIGVPNPMFAAFGSSDDEQRAMSEATQLLTRGTSAHGNAGEASIFLVLADRKLKGRGVLALVMPLSLLSGEAWEDSRRLLAEGYSDLVLVSITGAETNEVSFSADTGMGECLVVGRKTGIESRRALFVVLRERPAFPLLGARIADEIRRAEMASSIHKLEDGPVGGTPISFGEDLVGYVMDAPLPKKGGWNLARIADLSLAQTAYQLAVEGRIWLPTMIEAHTYRLPMTTVATVGKIGPYHMDVAADTSSGGVRGPFKIRPVRAGTVPTYPVLWAHDAIRERTLAFSSDSEGEVRKGKTATEQALVTERVAKVWASASHCHFNRDFRFNSQSTSMQYTPERSIGGRAWPSISLASPEHEKALVLWSNTTLGMLLYWWHSNKQQGGRGSIGISSLESLPILNVAALGAQQLASAVKLFDAKAGEEFLPLNEAARDAARAELDRAFFTTVLGLPAALVTPGGPLELVRRKLAAEPSVTGHKRASTRSR